MTWLCFGFAGDHFRLSTSDFRLRKRGLPEAATGGFGSLSQLLERSRSDAARGEIDDARQRAIVVGIGYEPQVGERVLDLLALEEAQAAVDAVGDAGGEERVLQHARLGVGAVEHRELAQP